MFPVLAVVAFTAVVVAAFLASISGFPWFRFPLGALLAYAVAMLSILVARRMVHVSLPDGYFRIRAFECDGHLYRRVGVRVFGRLLVLLGLDACNWLVRFSGRRSELRKVAHGMRQAESDHAMSLLVLLLELPFALESGWYEVAGWLVLVNVLANLYPVMLQRHNRARLEPLLERTR